MVAEAKATVKSYAQQIKDAQFGRDHTSAGGTPPSGAQLEAAQAALNTAENNLKAARLVYGVNDRNGRYFAVKRVAMNWIISAKRPTRPTGFVPLSDEEKANIIAYMDQELPTDKKITPTAREQEIIDLMPYYMELVTADYETLVLFADYFNVSIDYLLGRTDNPEINR